MITISYHDFDELDDYINSDNDGLFVLSSPEGYGKTVLLANYAYKLENTDCLTFFRFCGVTDFSGDVYSLWRSIVEEWNRIISI